VTLNKTTVGKLSYSEGKGQPLLISSFSDQNNNTLTSLTIDNCTLDFSESTIPSGDHSGGVINIAGHFETNIVLLNSKFLNINIPGLANGGALCVFGCVGVNVTGCNFSNITGARVGGAIVFGSVSNEIFVSGSSFVSCIASVCYIFIFFF
jgi:hypothetical protein